MACFAVAPLRREPGHRAAWKTSGRYLLSGLVFPAAIYAFTPRPSRWWLLLCAARAALHWCFEQKADLVVLSGDITDSGREEEWQLLHGLLAGLSPTEAGRLLVIPGNHDLTITLETYPETDGRLVLAHEKRCRSFARHVLAHLSLPESCFTAIGRARSARCSGAARITRSPMTGRLRASGPSGSNGGASGRSSGRSCARATAPPPGGLAI